MTNETLKNENKPNENKPIRLSVIGACPLDCPDGCSWIVDLEVAFICIHECTFCPNCAAEHSTCPNCGCELVIRPRAGVVSEATWMTAQKLDSFNQAWLDGNVEFLDECITDDCVYCASVGSEPGRTFSGRQAVEAGSREIIAYESGGTGKCEPARVFGSSGFAEWSYTKQDATGRMLEIRGCDYFQFDGDRICRKDAFIKSLTMEGATNE